MIRPGSNVLALDYPMSLGLFDRYEDAQRAVDYLSDNEFPVQHVLIVGTELKQIERVTGRLTTGKAVGAGALSGAWLGLFVGMIFALFQTSGFALASILSTVLFGVVFGAVWAFVGYRFTRGQRDFTSVSQVVATKYEVLTEHKHAVQGRELLARMDPMRAAQEQARVKIEQARAREAAASDQPVQPGQTAQPGQAGPEYGTPPPFDPRG